MERIIELMSMPYVQMSILDRLELYLHFAIIILLFCVLFIAFYKVFR